MKGMLCEASEGKTGMQRIHNIMRKGAGASVLVLAVPVLSLCAARAGAQSTPTVVMSQVSELAALPSGGALTGGAPSGSSMAVDKSGNVIVSSTYGKEILEFQPGATSATVLGGPFTNFNPGGVALDPAGNLYLANTYNGTIIKIPVSNGTYAAIPEPTGSTAQCTGNDTAECAMPTSLPVSGVVGMVFDSSGDLFVTSTNASTNPNSIVECTSACLLTGTPAPAVLFSESTTATTEGSSSAIYNLGGIALDPWGDVFFTDSLMDVTGGSSGESYGGDVKELVYSGSAYSSTPVTLATLTDSSPGDYDNQLDGVAVDSNGTVYFATQYDGIFALPNNKGTVNTATIYTMSTQGAKIMTTDGVGNFYVVTYVSGDAAVWVGIGNLKATASSVGSSSTTTNITTVVNDQGCSASPSVNFTAAQGSSSTTEFSAATSGSCKGISNSITSAGSTFATTLTFTPAYGGTRTAVLTATETGGSGSSATANVSGFATGTIATPTFSPVAGTYNAAQSVAISDSSSGTTIYYTTDGSTPSTSSTQYTGAITVSNSETINAIATASGATNSAVGSAAYSIVYPAATPTFSPAGGSYSAAQTVTIADATSGATIYYTTNGTTPTTGSSVYSGPITVSSSSVLEAIAVVSGAPTSSVGAATFAINSSTNGTSLSVLTNQTSTLGTYQGGGALAGANPAGSSFAVDASGNLILGTTYGNAILEFPQGATTGTVLSSSFSNAGAVAIDASGNLYLAQLYNGTIAKIPPSGSGYATVTLPGSGTPQCTGSDTAECVLPVSMPVSGISAMTIDAAGDLFLTSTAGSTNPNSVIECTAACVKSGSPAPTVLWSEPTATVTEGSASASWTIGEIAVDPWGDVFFTDTLMVASANTNYQSTLKELTNSGGTYSSTATTLYTETDSSPGAYDNQMDAVAVDANGTVYFADQYSGVYAFGNNKGTVNTNTQYTVSTQGAKIITLDSKGNLYLATYSSSASSDVAMEIAINNVTLPNAAVAGSSTATNVTTILNDGGCSTSPVVTFSATENGAASTEFLANTTGSCSSTPTGGASFPTNVTFNPTTAGTHVGLLTAVDTVNGGVGVANVYGVTSGSAAAEPTFSPAAGTYTSIQTVTISDATPGATIYYTTDGTAPTTSSMKYAGAITVSSTETISAIAVATGVSNSSVATATYTLNLPLTTTPTISVASGTYTSIQTVKISDGTLGSKIYYTTDGSTPTTSSTQYKSPITVSTSETLNAIAVAAGYAPSAVATATYTINLTVTTPTFSPAAGTYTTIQTVTLADSTSGASIYYTTDGSTPTASSTLYSGPIQVLGSETINAIGVLTGYNNSAVASATYTLNLPQAATPTISLGSGTYTVSQPVTVTDTTTGATIYYTLDGTTPTSSSKVYSAALTLSASETLKAIAVAVGYAPSAVATSTYTVDIMPAGFALSVNPSSLTIPSTSTFGTVQLTVQPEGGFTGAVALTCSGLPSGASCGFSSSPVNLTNYNTPQVTTVTVSTGQVAMLRHRSNPLVPEATLALALCFLGFRKRRGVQILLLAVISILGVTMLAGCGSSGPGTTTSTATITATSGSISTKTTVSITMNQ
jgi:Chitobiase/beta-hexosaminidase C-terminal domain